MKLDVVKPIHQFMSRKLKSGMKCNNYCNTIYVSKCTVMENIPFKYLFLKLDYKLFCTGGETSFTTWLSHQMSKSEVILRIAFSIYINQFSG